VHQSALASLRFALAVTLGLLQRRERHFSSLQSLDTVQSAAFYVTEELEGERERERGVPDASGVQARGLRDV